MSVGLLKKIQNRFLYIIMDYEPEETDTQLNILTN
jgi:hypothetical protein